MDSDDKSRHRIPPVKESEGITYLFKQYIGFGVEKTPRFREKLQVSPCSNAQFSYVMNIAAFDYISVTLYK